MTEKKKTTRGSSKQKVGTSSFNNPERKDIDDDYNEQTKDVINGALKSKYNAMNHNFHFPEVKNNNQKNFLDIRKNVPFNF